MTTNTLRDQIAALTIYGTTYDPVTDMDYIEPYEGGIWIKREEVLAILDAQAPQATGGRHV